MQTTFNYERTLGDDGAIFNCCRMSANFSLDVTPTSFSNLDVVFIVFWSWILAHGIIRDFVKTLRNIRMIPLLNMKIDFWFWDPFESWFIYSKISRYLIRFELWSSTQINSTLRIKSQLSSSWILFLSWLESETCLFLKLKFICLCFNKFDKVWPSR